MPSTKLNKFLCESPLLFTHIYGIMYYYRITMGNYRPAERKTRDMKLVLASASPRRREILTTLGVDFTIRTAEADESCDLSDPGARVEAISVKKCHAVRDALAAEGVLDSDTVILASDPLVMLDGEFLGKPRDEADARRMVGMLQGRTHTVASGLASYKDGRTVTAHELTGVTFAPMNETEIEAYIATGESFGKAGGYAVQGFAARFISGLEGDYFNVVGLPVRRLYETLREGFDIIL